MPQQQHKPSTSNPAPLPVPSLGLEKLSGTTPVRVHTCFTGLHLIWTGAEKHGKHREAEGSTSANMSLSQILSWRNFSILSLLSL